MRMVVVSLLAAAVVACGRRTDLPVPAPYADEVELARQSLSEAWEGPIESTFSFRELLCRKDGGLVVVFLQDGFGADGLAVAMQGPNAAPDGWAGGFGIDDAATDPEVQHFFEESPEVPCPS